MSKPISELRHRKPVAKTKQQNMDKEEQKLKKQIKVSSSSREYLTALGLFVMALPIRLKHLGSPNQVIFDEVHFGKHASYYINQTFFFDVHPPLAKLLIALVAWIFGFDGDFDFKEIGSTYPEDVPYTEMRAFGALLGTLVVPLAYLTIRDAGHSNIAAVITALAICFENGLITNNRLIVLDAYLLFFTSFTVFSYTRFHKQSALSRSWYTWLLCTGIGLGCSFSSKWVGIFTIATIGLSTVKQLWDTLGDLQVSKRQYAMHLFARVFALIIIPTAIYLGSFYAHFAILNRSGPGDTYMALETQNELRGIEAVDTPLPIAYGSLITMRHLATTGGYLHSHRANYEEGSNQQQVTVYPFKDENNWWRILKADEEKKPIEDLLGSDQTTWLEYVRNGDMIRLEHVATAPRKLHSHDFPAPVTDTTYHKEVSGYGFPNHTGDSNDFWRVQIDNNSRYPEAGQYLESRRSEFRLFHTNQDCHLYSTFERLPDWGFQQQEVSCIQEGMKPKTMWVIDETMNLLLPTNATMVPEHRPGFFEKLVHLHKRMWTTNHELTESHPYQSRPYEWPVLHSGIMFWISPSTQIILLGNPVVFWTSTVAVFTFMILFGFFQLRDKRGFQDHYHGLRAYYENSGGFFVLGWCLHYLPFYYLGRQLFLHHYMPALYFAVLTLGVGLDLVTRRFPQAVKMAALVAVGASIGYTYYVYSPITYGETWSVNECQKASLLSSWNLDCHRYTKYEAPLQHVELAQEKYGQQTAGLMSFEEQDEPAQIVLKHNHDEGMTGSNDAAPPAYLEQEGQIIMTENDDEEDDEDDEDDEDEYELESDFAVPTSTIDDYEDEDEDELEEPTEAPIYEEPEPEFIDGKERVGDDDEDEDDWPRTTYGVDPEDEENTAPLTTREIPATRLY